MLVTLYLPGKFKQLIKNQNYHLKRLASTIMTIGLIAMAGCFTSCGKRRPPIPPTRTTPGNYLSAVQRGNIILLKITIPPAAKEIKQISIYRLNESLSNQAPLSEDDFASRSTLIGVAEPLSSEAVKTVYYQDPLSNTALSNRLRYAVRLVFLDGRRSTLSNYLMIEPSFQIPLPPIFSKITVGQTAIQLEWQKPETNLDSSKPVNLIGYNVYRAEGKPDDKIKSSAIQLLNPSPITETSFNDLNFQFGSSYQYFIRAVASSNGSGAGGDNVQIESLDSNAQAVIPRDNFPPAAPQNLTIAASPNRLSLFFAANNESDLAGYLVYRAQDENTPLPQWQKLTANLFMSNTFQDTAVETGQKYFYYLRAVDNAGNISEPSEIVSETVP
jgi:hypothetical protein